MLEEEREEAAEHIDSPRLIKIFPIRQVVLARAQICSWACWARFFIEKKMDSIRYNTFTCVLPFFVYQGRQECIDHSQSCVILSYLITYLIQLWQRICSVTCTFTQFSKAKSMYIRRWNIKNYCRRRLTGSNYKLIAQVLGCSLPLH